MGLNQRRISGTSLFVGVVSLLAFPCAIRAAGDVCWCPIGGTTYNPGGTNLKNFFAQDYLGANATLMIDIAENPPGCELGGRTVEISVDGRTEGCGLYPGGNWSGACSIGVPGPDGEKTAVIKCMKYSSDGQVDGSFSKDYPFILDTTPPSPAVDSPPAWSILPKSTLTMAGRVGDASSMIKDYGVALAGIDVLSKTSVYQKTAAWTAVAPSSQVANAAMTGPAVYISVWAFDLVGNTITYRHPIYIDGVPPNVAITTPPNSATWSLVEAISGAATDYFGLKTGRVLIRQNSDGRYWNGSAFADPSPRWEPLDVSGSDAEWSYRIDNERLTNLSSYTVLVQAEDSVGNLSDIAASTFTFDPCSDDPPLQEVTDWRFYAREAHLHPDISCVVQNCAQTVAIDPGTGVGLLRHMTRPRANRAVTKKICTDSRRCPTSTGIASPNGDFGVARPGTMVVDGKKIPRWHQGVDYSLPGSKNIASATNGTVIFAGEMWPGDATINPKTGMGKSWGFTVLIRSATKVGGKYEYVLYAHLERPSIEAGATVAMGEQIGVGDTTGETKALHLHVEAFYIANEIPPYTAANFPAVDPLKLPNFGNSDWLTKLKNSHKKTNPSPDKTLGCNKY